MAKITITPATIFVVFTASTGGYVLAAWKRTTPAVLGQHFKDLPLLQITFLNTSLLPEWDRGDVLPVAEAKLLGQHLKMQLSRMMTLPGAPKFTLL